LMMPVLDGFGFVAEMRRNPSWQHIPIVVISAKDLTESERQQLSGAVDQVIAKGGLSPDELVKLLHHYLHEKS
jgi:CheY-like chemotaxis protein